MRGEKKGRGGKVITKRSLGLTEEKNKNKKILMKKVTDEKL